jgi:diacylglycerol kinase
MNDFLRSRLLSFRHAFSGWRYMLRTQPNAWIHAAATIVVFLTGLWLKLSASDWVLIVIAVGLVWITEFINTALEAVVDLVSSEYHNLAKISKDVGAASVLIATAVAVLIGILVLGPLLWVKLSQILAM